ncbi:MAG: 23S rRNA (uracil(1939)-C(5))-methyltransferase RlmD [Solobacterium sp.]|nr:23S rRNA (uracil(1939)-C(5))-methyltransferase RlmD [Solobacterium sp.]
MSVCPYHEKCGGCDYSEIPYEEQLVMKQKELRRLFGTKRIEPVIGMKDPAHYRHKVYATFAKNRNGRIVAGIYEENSHHLIYVRDCMIQHETANRIISSICRIASDMHIEVYNENTHTGVLRHAYIRVSRHSGEAMAVIVVGSQTLPGSRKFISKLVEENPEIVTVIINRNNRHTSMILGKEERVVYGDGTITDEISGLKFRISSRSFYQVNPVQTEILYRTALDLAAIGPGDRVLDACCGIGTISLLAAKRAKHVTGIEIVPDAIRDAKYNAKLNGIRNAEFYCADEKKYLLQTDETYDVVIMDPPRAGMSEEFLNSLSAEKLVYISCNPETQKRDIDILRKKGYRPMKIVPCDMFPFTKHVESIVSLKRQDS